MRSQIREHLLKCFLLFCISLNCIDSYHLSQSWPSTYGNRGSIKQHTTALKADLSTKRVRKYVPTCREVNRKLYAKTQVITDDEDDEEDDLVADDDEDEDDEEISNDDILEMIRSLKEEEAEKGEEWVDFEDIIVGDEEGDILITDDMMEEDEDDPTESIVSLFDSIYNSKKQNEGDFGISFMTLRDIAQAYRFSIDYLGDFAASLGVPCPVALDTAVGNMLQGDKVFLILQAVTSQDPLDTSEGYDTPSLITLSEQLEVSVKELVDICERDNIRLPFGRRTRLHKSQIERVKRLVDFGSDDIDTMYDSAPLELQKGRQYYREGRDGSIIDVNDDPENYSSGDGRRRGGESDGF